jgi:hypothetical protein
MKCVYEAPNALEARMIADVIERSGISCRIDGEYLQGGVGELFVGDFIRILVEDEDYVAGRVVVKNWEATEVVEEPEIAPKSKINIIFSVSLSLLVGLIIGVGCTYFYFNTSITYGGMDHNRDGINDEVWTYVRGRIHKTEVDGNFDGEFDEIYTHTLRGGTNYSESDINFDGVFETFTMFENNLAYSSKQDTTNDGFKDLHTYYSLGVVDTVEFYDAATGHLIKTQKFNGFKLVSSKFDSNNDGVLDTIVEYDQYEEVK